MHMLYILMAVAIGFVIGVAAEKFVGRKESKIEGDRRYCEGYRDGFGSFLKGVKG